MFRCVDLPFDTEDFLRPRDPDVVYEALPEVAKPRPISRAAERRQPRAASPAMKVDAEPRSEPAERLQLRLHQFVNIGIALEDRAKSPLHDHAGPQIRPMPLQNIKRARREHAISERT